MPVDDAPDDDSVRQSYNFAPGYHGLVYRADGQDYGPRTAGPKEGENEHGDHDGDAPKDDTLAGEHKDTKTNTDTNTKYRLQAMKWGKLLFSLEWNAPRRC
jgi:hypothetical protein